MQEILGFEDRVKGFDLEFMTEDSIDFLDIYAEFLGLDEYYLMKENYQKALGTMNELYQVEIDRFRLNAPVEYEDLLERFEH